VIVGLSNESFKKEVINLDTLANGSIDGFILSVAKETLSKGDYHHLHETIDQGIPIVMFDRVIDDIDCDKVIVDDIKTSQRAVQKLIDNGCEKIGIISTKDYVSVGKLRTEGYLKALEVNQKNVNLSYILKIHDEFSSDDNLEALEQQIFDYLSKNKDLDAIFAVNELYAVTAMKVARKLGLSIPNDIQFIGFTDGVLSKHAFPPLTTVSQNGFEMGRTAAKLLINRLEKDREEIEHFETVIVNTNIIERETTQKLK
jgi:LacI family transcriptional regulator